MGAGLFLAPPEDVSEVECDPTVDENCPETETAPATAAEEPNGSNESGEGILFDYVKLSNQFVVPIIRDERVAALVVVSVTLEVDVGAGAAVFDREPRIRDAFLQEMFDFAYLGGFDGPFTKSENLMSLRRALKEIGQRIAGPVVKDVLIVDLVRQEV